MPLEVNEIKAYMEVAEIDGAEKMKFLRLMKKMDRVELKYLAEKTRR